MASIAIHTTIAKQYIKKHPNEIKEEKEFIDGAIAPNFNETTLERIKEKNSTHYGKWRNGEIETHIDQFLKDKKVDLKKDYWKGYLIHLLTDFYFYHQYFNQEFREQKVNNDNFYYDYDCINKILIEKYQLNLGENLKKYMNYIDEEPKYLKIDKVINFIDEMSNLDLDEQIKLINEKGMEGIENEHKN